MVGSGKFWNFCTLQTTKIPDQPPTVTWANKEEFKFFSEEYKPQKLRDSVNEVNAEFWAWFEVACNFKIPPEKCRFFCFVFFGQAKKMKRIKKGLKLSFETSQLCWPTRART